MDERDGRVAALPCCFGWIRETYGFVDEAPLDMLWNSPGAQRIRGLIASGRQDEICDRHCKYLTSGLFSEAAWAGRVIDGSAAFVANQELNEREILERRTVLRSRPVMMKVLTNFECNIRCVMCFQKHFGDAGHGEGFWQQIEAHLPFVHEVIFQGGEATIDPGFRAFLAGEALRNNSHVGVGLITNGTVLDAALQRAVGEIRMQFVSVSINAADALTYRAIAGRDSFARVVENCRRWAALAAHHPRGSFPIYASFVVMRRNVAELADFVRLVAEIGARPRLQMLIGDAEQGNILLRPELHDELRRALDAAERVAGEEALREISLLRNQLPAGIGVA